ncbi:helix-turn-helix transcriptional regulator [uncultured Photobacterium sp.]|uniref:helix-turn-helix domain-containing protein n=1 Tax=uncultured Photobacterium sp. TaxID=173973 RepID=UPI0026176DF6|nr:helix-turn-helix transcriptional regulator [uncultured Photobacterium sp.]
MQKLTKHDTMLWINHAIANFKSLGKNQKDLAARLGVEESRLSEMKSGAGVISPVLMEKIVDLCGAPRRNPGRFETVELYDSLDTFFELFGPVTENRFLRQLLKTFNSKAYIDLIIKHCELEEGSHECTNDEDRRSLIMSRIDELVRSEEFNVICDEYNEHLRTQSSSLSDNGVFRWENCQHSKSSYRNDHLKMSGLCISNSHSFHAMYLLWLLVGKFDNYRLGSNEAVNLSHIKELSPVVLTGNKLISICNDYCVKSLINDGVKTVYGLADNYTEIHECRSIYNRNFRDADKISHTPDMWRDVRCELYLTENMNYHLLIHLAPKHIITGLDMSTYDENASVCENSYFGIIQKEDRAAVITNINPLELFRQIEEVRKWCGLPEDSYYELKKEIAKAGGYVPGAKVLF